jgi:hypothetical protein
MRKSTTLVAIAVACLMVLAGAVAWAQSGGRDACVDACEQAKQECINRCDAHENPMECDEHCEDAEVDCIRMCH